MIFANLISLFLGHPNILLILNKLLLFLISKLWQIIYGTSHNVLVYNNLLMKQLFSKSIKKSYPLLLFISILGNLNIDYKCINVKCITKMSWHFIKTHILLGYCQCFTLFRSRYITVTCEIKPMTKDRLGSGTLCSHFW